MKTLIPCILVFLLCGSFGGDPPIIYTNYAPIMMHRDQLENSITTLAPKNLRKVGKIYKVGSWLFVNEQYEGIHVINNADPKNPQTVGYITVPGCIDMAYKDGYLYVDNGVDLVTLDIRDGSKVREVARIRNAFPEPVAPDMRPIPEAYKPGKRPADLIIIGWEPKI